MVSYNRKQWCHSRWQEYELEYIFYPCYFIVKIETCKSICLLFWERIYIPACCSITLCSTHHKYTFIDGVTISQFAHIRTCMWATYRSLINTCNLLMKFFLYFNTMTSPEMILNCGPILILHISRNIYLFFALNFGQCIRPAWITSICILYWSSTYILMHF